MTSFLRVPDNIFVGNEIGAPLLKAEAQPEPKSVRLGFVAGMIAQEKLTPFERLLFRATRGNMFLKSVAVGQVLDPTTSEKQEKAVFVVFFAGDRARSKILKVSNLSYGKFLLEVSAQACACTAEASCSDWKSQRSLELI